MAANNQNNIGASRLLGTNGLQQAVDSFTSQIGKLTSDIGKLIGSMQGLTSSNNRASGSSSYSNNWNANSNRAGYGANGGGGVFGAAQRFLGGGRNGGGANFGALGAGSRLSAGASAILGVGAALTNYGNKNMSANMQMDYFGTQSAVAGGFSNLGAARNLAMRQAFSNQYGALSAQDAAQAAYYNQYTFGNSQFNGSANPLFTWGSRQVGGFAIANPTLGLTAAAQAAQQTYTPQAFYTARAYGIASPLLPGGRMNSMSAIAQSFYARTFGNNKPLKLSDFNAALRQNGTLNWNVNFLGQQMGFSQSTIQEYLGILQGQASAQAKGISANQYYSLLDQAQGGGANGAAARKKLTSFGLQTSMFENQKNLNATRLTRQEDILESLAPAFDNATKMVNKFSQALTDFLKMTGLDKAIGTGAGWATPFSNSLSGFSGAFGAGLGLLGAARLFGFGGGVGGVSTGGLGGFAGGAYNITTLGGGATAAGGSAAAMTRFLPVVGTIGAAAALGSKSQQGMNNAINRKGANTSDWIHWFDSHKWKTQQDRINLANQFFTTYPGAKVAPDAIKMFMGSGYKPPVSSGQSGGGSSSVVGNSVSNGSKNVGANAAEIIRWAETQLNVPYVWGGESPGRGFDCSGLTQWAYGKAGVKIPRVAADQQKTGTQVPTNQTQPGDLLFVGNPAHHVVMSIGGGKIIEAPHTGDHVKIRALNPSEFTSATRIVGAVGNMDSLLNGNSSGNQNTLNNQQSLSGGDIGGFGGTSEAAIVASALASTIGGIPLTAGSASAANTSGGAVETPKSNGRNDKGSLQAYAKQLLAKYGWAGQWNSFNALVMSESGWDVHATNKQSGAYGIPQSLPGNKMASAGSDWQSNGDTQLQWMMSYIKGRYGSPDNAWSFHQKNNWYANGAWNIDKDQHAVVHQGEMIIPAQQAETIRQTLLNNSFNPNVTKNATGGASISIGDINVNLPSTFTGTTQEAQQIGKTISQTIKENLRIQNLQQGN